MSWDFKTPLFDPPDATIDIVFVHGLRGHPKNTWTTSSGLFWPKDLLPSTIPEARIFSWGYDADIVHFWQSKESDYSINDYARSLLSDLAGIRTESLTRPIVLVAHSLGGIVCANAIVLANGMIDYLGDTGKHIRGIVFLGTPLRGSDKARWAERARVFWKCFLQENDSDIPQQLEKKSFKLIDMLEQFTQVVKTREKTAPDVKLLCMWEGKNTPPLGMIVDRDSACLDSTISFCIQKDHVGMCKFNSIHDVGYDKITDTIKNWMEELRRESPESSIPRGIYIEGSNFGHNNRNLGTQVGTALGMGNSPAFTTTSYYYTTPPDEFPTRRS